MSFQQKHAKIHDDLQSFNDKWKNHTPITVEDCLIARDAILTLTRETDIIAPCAKQIIHSILKSGDFNYCSSGTVEQFSAELIEASRSERVYIQTTEEFKAIERDRRKKEKKIASKQANHQRDETRRQREEFQREVARKEAEKLRIQKAKASKKKNKTV